MLALKMLPVGMWMLSSLAWMQDKDELDESDENHPEHADYVTNLRNSVADDGKVQLGVEPGRDLGNCLFKYQGRSIGCSYSPDGDLLRTFCNCGSKAHYRTVIPMPPEHKGAELEDLASWCVDFSVQRCAKVRAPIELSCEAKGHRCKVEQRFDGGDLGQAERKISCTCRARKDRPLKWQQDSQDTPGSYWSKAKLQSVCEQELALCDRPDDLAENHPLMDDSADVETRSYALSCSHQGHSCVLEHQRKEGKGLVPRQDCRCGGGFGHSGAFPKPKAVSSMNDCFRALARCERLEDGQAPAKPAPQKPQEEDAPQEQTEPPKADPGHADAPKGSTQVMPSSQRPRPSRPASPKSSAMTPRAFATSSDDTFWFWSLGALVVGLVGFALWRR